MKIGILTYHYSNNYGALLQAYALTIVLKEMGHEVRILNRLPDTVHKRSLKSKVKCLINKWFKHSFINFRKTHLSITEKLESFEDLVNISEKLDAVIVGSDQVWRLDYTQGLGLNNFLDFVPDQVTKIAYAASFGKDSFDGDAETISEVKKLLHRFKAISVREASGVTICKDIFNRQADHLLDPTMLLSPQDYNALINKDELKDFGKFVTRYLLDPTSYRIRIVEYLAQKQGCNIFNIYRDINSDFSLKSFDFNWKKYCYPSFSTWLSGIKHSEFVITDSFHGAVFSILFNKQFVCIANENRGLTRMTNLLNKFGLLSRLIKSSDEMSILDSLEDIDYTQVNEILSLEREKSFCFLRESLNSKKRE